MKNELFAALLLAAPAWPAGSEEPAPAQAQPSKIESLKTWFKHLRQALEKSAAERHYQRRGSLGAVAAVRGAEQKLDDPDKPYWKGAADSKGVKERRQERAELAVAVDLILEGQHVEAKAKLDAFEAAHPQSTYLKDLRETRDKLQELAAEEKPQAEPPKPGASE